jgi:ABC-type polysaccharide/polyol phosphate transport system ATPase subunit
VNRLPPVRLCFASLTDQGVVMTTTATTATAPAVEVIGLTKIYGSGNTEVVAMKDVSLRVARGEVIALLGSSGADTPTLLILPIPESAQKAAPGRDQVHRTIVIGVRLIHLSV